MMTGKEQFREWRRIARDLKQRPSSETNTHMPSQWQNLHILIRRMLAILHSGFQPSPSDMERTQDNIIRVLASLKDQDEVLGKFPQFFSWYWLPGANTTKGTRAVADQPNRQRKAIH